MEKRPHDRREKKPHYRVRTQLIHGSFVTKRWDYDHHVVPPISSSATFRLSSVERGAQGFVEFASDGQHFRTRVPIYVYDRLDEPTRGMLEENLATAEGGEACVTFSTGMAAVAAALSVTVAAGQEIIAHPTLYGCTHSLLTTWMPRNAVKVKWADLCRPDCLREAVTPATRVVYFESPLNPTMELIDIAALAKVVNELNAQRPSNERIWVLIDNTFATPYCQRPLALGADIVIHSLTKNIGGFGTDMGGAVIGPDELYNLLLIYRKDFGGVLSPKSAWAILVYGLPTLAARMANQQKTALKVAQFLETHAKVSHVSYPGLESFKQRELAHRQMVCYDGKFSPGSMLYFCLKDTGNGAHKAADRVVDWIAEHSYTITLAVSLGQIKTLIENPFSMTHSGIPEEEKIKLGIEPGGIRLSVGLEDWHDIIDDLRMALDQI